MSRAVQHSATVSQNSRHPPTSASTTPASSPESGEKRMLQALIDAHLAAANVLKQALREVEAEDEQRRLQAVLAAAPVARAPTVAPAPEPVDWHLVTVNEACEGLGIGRTTIYAMIAAKKLSAVKIGRRTLLKVAELQELVTSRSALVGPDQDPNACNGNGSP